MQNPEFRIEHTSCGDRAFTTAEGTTWIWLRPQRHEILMENLRFSRTNTPMREPGEDTGHVIHGTQMTDIVHGSAGTGRMYRTSS